MLIEDIVIFHCREYYFSGIVIVAVLGIPLIVSPIVGVSQFPLSKGDW